MCKPPPKCISSKSKKTKQDLLVMYANVRGIKGKKTGMTEILQQQEPHIFLIAETQLRSDMAESFVGYTCFQRKREGKVGELATFRVKFGGIV